MNDLHGVRARIARSGLFDDYWYLSRNDDVVAAGHEPLKHFLDYGHAEGRWPNRYFDPAWYREENPDVAEAGLDPLIHYLQDGDREGRQPSIWFKPGWYRQAYQLPNDQLALAHFLRNRNNGAVAPNASMFAVPMLPSYRHHLAAGLDPFAHYLDDLHGREVFPDLDVVRAAGLLDENYYLVNAADVYHADMDPLDHYCRFGWQERRKPNIYFDPTWYLQTNPAVARLQVNPLVHYILVGEASNRRPVPFFDPNWYRAEYQIPYDSLALSHYLANRHKQCFSPTPLFDVASYVSRFGSAIGPNRDPFTHYLRAGTIQDIDPSRWFNAALYRNLHLGRTSRQFTWTLRPDQHNPLAHFLRSAYERQVQNG